VLAAMSPSSSISNNLAQTTSQIDTVVNVFGTEYENVLNRLLVNVDF